MRLFAAKRLYLQAYSEISAPPFDFAGHSANHLSQTYYDKPWLFINLIFKQASPINFNLILFMHIRDT